MKSVTSGHMDQCQDFFRSVTATVTDTLIKEVRDGKVDDSRLADMFGSQTFITEDLMRYDPRLASVSGQMRFAVGSGDEEALRFAEEVFDRLDELDLSRESECCLDLECLARAVHWELAMRGIDLNDVMNARIRGIYEEKAEPCPNPPKAP